MGAQTTAQLKKESGRLRIGWLRRRRGASDGDEVSEQRPEDIAVPLQRLLSVVTLTPAQAALLARDVIGWLDAYERIGSDGVVLDARAVRVTGNGQVRFTPDWDGGTGRNTLASAASLVHQLVGSAQQGGPKRQRAVARLSRLQETGDDLRELAAQVDTVATELLDGGGPRRVHQVRRGLGALVVACRGLDPEAEHESPIAPVQLVAPVVANRHLGPPTGRVSRRVIYHRRSRGHRLKVFFIGLVLVALVALIWWAAPRLWDELRDGWDDIFGSSDPPPVQIEPVSPPPEAEDEDDGGDDDASDDADPDAPVDVEPSAPDSAGAVSEVRLEAVAGECTPGESCAVRVEVALEAGGPARTVNWIFEVVDRCDDDVSTQSGVTVTAQAGWTEVWGQSQIDIPEGSALAVMAVTEAPDEASSSPMLIPEDPGSC
jgi:hypothetical protein